MSEKTAHLLEEFDALPTDEKKVFTVEILAHAQARGLPLPLLFEQALKRKSHSSKPSLSAAERVSALRDWAASHPITPLLSDEAIRRENLYPDRG
jgi:hypothetical protein